MGPSKKMPMWPEDSSTDQSKQRVLESHLKSRALSTPVKCPNQVGAGEPCVGQGQLTGSKMPESGDRGLLQDPGQLKGHRSLEEPKAIQRG